MRCDLLRTTLIRRHVRPTLKLWRPPQRHFHPSSARSFDPSPLLDLSCNAWPFTTASGAHAFDALFFTALVPNLIRFLAIDCPRIMERVQQEGFGLPIHSGWLEVKKRLRQKELALKNRTIMEVPKHSTQYESSTRYTTYLLLPPLVHCFYTFNVVASLWAKSNPVPLALAEKSMAPGTIEAMNEFYNSPILSDLFFAVTPANVLTLLIGYHGVRYWRDNTFLNGIDPKHASNWPPLLKKLVMGDGKVVPAQDGLFMPYWFHIQREAITETFTLEGIRRDFVPPVLSWICTLMLIGPLSTTINPVIGWYVLSCFVAARFRIFLVKFWTAICYHVDRRRWQQLQAVRKKMVAMRERKP